MVAYKSVRKESFDWLELILTEIWVPQTRYAWRNSRRYAWRSPIYSIRLAIFYLQKNSKLYKECMPLVEFLPLVMILHFLRLFFSY